MAKLCNMATLGRTMLMHLRTDMSIDMRANMHIDMCSDVAYQLLEAARAMAPSEICH